MDINNTLFAFYGSLRMNMPLHDRFKRGLEYKFSAWAKGFQLFSLGDFPCAVKSNLSSDKMMIEIFKIDDLVIANEIDSIEIGYGYYRDSIVVDNCEALIYLFKDAANYPQVLSGDWVKFFRAQR